MREATNIVMGATTVVAIAAIITLNIPHLLYPPPTISNSSTHVLDSAVAVNVTAAFGPESLAFDRDGRGPYTGVADGRILRWDRVGLSWVEFAFTSPADRRKECIEPFAPEKEHICGRPLGLKFDPKNGDLYVADAYFGLHVVGPQGGLTSKVVTEAQGRPLYFTNDLDIDDLHDVIYFTDSSTQFRRRHFMNSVLSGDKTGRFLKYDKSTEQVTVLLQDLAFANGVALSKDRSFVLIAETRSCRILRYWITGPKSGEVETFADLPGYPDNVRMNSKGEFWVALHGKKTPLADWLFRNTWAGKLLLKIPLSFQKLHILFMGKHHAIAIKLSSEGEVLQVVEDVEGKNVRYVSEVEEKDGKLWIGSVMMPSIWVYNLQ